MDALPNSSSPRAAYVHVPFCRHRCGYCNFTLVAGRDDLIGAYLDALERELSLLGEPQPVATLFFGGGTPSHLPPAALRRLLSLARHWFPLEPGGELSLEANPADVTPERVAVLAEAGVNRVSLGVQSFDSPKLATLERDHRADDVARAIGLLRRAVASLAIDLIFGVPGETLAVWQDDLSAALEAPLDHVSTYGLTYEKGAAFYGRRLRGALTEVPEATEAAMYETAIDRLGGGGFEHYEVSNFARPGHRCRHNETYWRGEPWHAAGPGAARFLGDRRETNHRSTTTYVRRLLAGRSPVAETEAISPDLAARERLVFGLRRLAGVDRREFLAATGRTIEDVAGSALARYLALNALEWAGDRLRLTRRGLLVSDSLWPAFL